MEIQIPSAWKPHDPLNPSGPPPMWGYPHHLGCIPTSPAPGSPLAYNENHIVSLIMHIFFMLKALGGSFWEPEYPPQGGWELDDDVCTEFGLSPRVISLMRRLPYYTVNDASGGPEVRLGAFMPDYREGDTLRYSRRRGGLPTWETEGLDVWGDPHTFKPHDLILFYNDERGETWILDTEANTIRRRGNTPPQKSGDLERWGRLFPQYAPENPVDPGDYRNQVPFHAPTVLLEYIDDLRRLAFIPVMPDDDNTIQTTDIFEGAPEIRRILKEEYGWPDNFREQDWAADGPGIWEEQMRLHRDDPRLNFGILKTAPYA